MENVVSAEMEWVVPPDMRIVPAASLDSTGSSDHRGMSTDVAIYRPRARRVAKIIGDAEAALLARFQRPTTIGDALIAYCAEHGGDPRELLMKAHGFLNQLARDGIIVPADSPEAAVVAPLFEAGQRIGAFVVVRCVSFAIDTEVYQAHDEKGGCCAVKIARNDSRNALDALEREASILARLGGAVSPRLISAGHVQERPYVTMSWHEGESPDTAARRIAADSLLGRARLARLAGAVLDAYVEFERCGVVHGDLHPGNLLVAPEGRAVFVDFGLATIPGDARWSTAPRGGIPFYIEPEYASALLSDRAPPQASAHGEQYSLAAILYRILTGVSYLQFSAEEAEVRRQIVDDDPRTFSDVGAITWPGVERVLRKALSKRPQDRFASVHDFRSAFADASRTHAASAARSTSESTRFVAHLSTKLAETAYAGRASLECARGGGAGAAFALYRLACVADDHRLLSAADIWATKAAQSNTSALMDSDDGAHADRERRLPLLFSAAGAHLASIHIQSALGNPSGVRDAVDGFCHGAREHLPSIDLTFGQAGVLLGVALVLGIPGIDADQRQTLVEFGRAIEDALAVRIRSLSRIHECAEVPNLGMAHGWAGILYSVMRWSQSAELPIPNYVISRLRELEACATFTRRGARWPWRDRLDDDTPSFMPGWCNGSAGFVHLWLLAARTLDASFDALARRAAWDAWEWNTPAWDLCCGGSGRAYALIALYRHTGDRAWLERALRLAARAVRDAGHAPLDATFRPSHNLNRGEAGVAVLAAELETIEDARMPLFEAERWPLPVTRGARG